MTAQGGYGLTAQIDVSASLAALVGVEDLDFPKFKKFLAEATHHGSAGGYYEAVDTGKKRAEPFRVTLFWDTSEASHAAVVAAFGSPDPVTFSVADPDGDETISFECHIEEIDRMSRQEEAYKAAVLIHPTGQPTIA